MQVGDLVKYKRCGTHGIVTRTWEITMPEIHGRTIKHRPDLRLEVLWSDGKVSDTRCRKVEVICK